MNNEWLTAYVLHRRPYRETSYIVDFFTLEEGRAVSYTHLTLPTTPYV